MIDAGNPPLQNANQKRISPSYYCIIYTHFPEMQIVAVAVAVAVAASQASLLH